MAATPLGPNLLLAVSARVFPSLLGAMVLFLVTMGCELGPDIDDWRPVDGLKTRWAADVDPALPLPEYPRPQMVRRTWTNLNGVWDLAVTTSRQDRPDSFPDRILVPFPIESALSGLGRPVSPEERVWYRRFFSLPEDGADSRWLLHFGAVDWEAEVFLNGVSLGTHRGGYDPFSFEITDQLLAGGDQELIVAVRDPTDQGPQPRGKQVLEPHGIWYTAVTGIWQTVWLEPVPHVYVSDLHISPDLPGGLVRVEIAVTGSEEPVMARATVMEGDQEVVTAWGPAGIPLALPIPHVRPWAPDHPFLYDLRIQLGEGRISARAEPAWVGDSIGSYFGMRSISVGPDEEGFLRLRLNGEPTFQYGLLDQGWWPDGLYTAPTDEALRSDIVRSRELGFNLIRKHVKVEPARWYYHADREGMLVWQDMPSGSNEGAEAQARFGQELNAVVGALENHPSIVTWVPFNEGWGQHDTEEYVSRLREADPTRLVDNASGWADRGVGDVLDIHRYPGPGIPDLDPLSTNPGGDEGPGSSDLRAGVLGEFGGLGLPLAGHTWVEEDNWGYRSYKSLVALNQAYVDLLTQLRPLIGEGLAAAVYTQTTDVEVEVNGVMTYDRGVVKLGEEAVTANRELFRSPPILRPVLESSRNRGREWRYTTSNPGEGWEQVAFDDGGWQRGPAGFGTERTPGAHVRTTWDTSEIWLRTSFSLTETALEELDGARLFLRIHHDEDAEVYLNGVRVASLEGYTTGYRLVPLPGSPATFLQEGENQVSVHVSQTEGGQYIDLGLVEWLEQDGR